MPRWSIDELVTRYVLEPELSDYFVEGEVDRTIYQSFASATKREDVIFYDISNVDIPAEMLGEDDLTNGQRQRVIYLLRRIEADAPLARCAGIIDRDLEDEFPTPISCNRVILTRYRDLESYFLTEDYLNQVVVRSGGAAVGDWSGFYRTFTEALLHLHSIRLANRQLNINARRVRIKKYADVSNEKVTLKLDDYVTALLGTEGALGRKDETLIAAQEWYKTFTGDPRHNIRGHDFIDLMLICLKKLKADRWPDEPALLAAFALTVYHSPGVLEDII